MTAERRPRRERLDRLMVDRGLAPNRSRAQALVLAGRVQSRGARVDKPGSLVSTETPLEVLPGPRYVSRGGFKLAAALPALGIDVRDRDALDVGASTGGFTQVLLELGARRVVALDVGRGQLDWTLRSDPRVVVLEGLNARYLEARVLPFRPDVVVMDVSFISVQQVLPAVTACLGERGIVVTLVKPQFEVGRGKVGRGGIVRDPALHHDVLLRTAGFARARGWPVRGVVRSSIRGAQGNVEFFLCLGITGTGLDLDALEHAVEDALRPTAEEERG